MLFGEIRPDPRTGLIIRDFTGGSSGHEGRQARQAELNVGFLAFHEGRGAGKSTTPEALIIVSRKKLLARENSHEKEKLREKSYVWPVSEDSTFPARGIA
jgi:hypothetical protein